MYHIICNGKLTTLTFHISHQWHAYLKIFSWLLSSRLIIWHKELKIRDSENGPKCILFVRLFIFAACSHLSSHISMLLFTHKKLASRTYTYNNKHLYLACSLVYDASWDSLVSRTSTSIPVCASVPKSAKRVPPGRKRTYRKLSCIRSRPNRDALSSWSPWNTP